MTARIFVSACILVGGLLVKLGAPLPAVAAGMALVAFWNWRRDVVPWR